MNNPVEKNNIIKGKLSNLIYRFAWRFLMFGFRLILKLRIKQYRVIFSKAYINANSSFPDSTLDENRKLAELAMCDFFEITPDVTIENAEKERVELFKDKLLYDENIKNDIANYFLIDAFYYSLMDEFITSESHIRKENEALAKARSYKESAEPFAYGDISKIEKKIKKELKELKKQIKKTTARKIEEEKSKIIGSIKITSSHILFFAYVFSGLFLVGGFLYTTVLLSFLEINASDFFDISDYISSGVDIIFPILIITTLLMVFIF